MSSPDISESLNAFHICREALEKLAPRDIARLKKQCDFVEKRLKSKQPVDRKLTQLVEEVHRLSIELDKKLSSISNGQLESSESLDEHTKVDHWVMAQPHAPYLVMMAIGPWHFEYDQWKSIPLVYAVEPSEKRNAKRMFHKTPDILTFFSKRLGVSYPWPSLRQVVVREYVSGAMENTTAVVHGESAYQSKGSEA